MRSHGKEKYNSASCQKYNQKQVLVRKRKQKYNDASCQKIQSKASISTQTKAKVHAE